MSNQVYLLPETIQVVKTLDNSHLQQYQESIKSYNNPKARQTLGEGNEKVSAQDQTFKGSSPFIQLQLLHINLEVQGQFPNQTRPATRNDLEKAIAQHPQFLRGTYADFGIAILPKPETYESNKPLYENLTQQFKARNLQLDQGKLIYFSGLTKPREDSDSPYGLTFDLKDIPTKDLEASIKNIDDFKWNWRKDKGLARACLDIAGYWSCDSDYLDYSGSYGRVVGVGVETQKNLNKDILMNN